MKGGKPFAGPGDGPADGVEGDVGHVAEEGEGDVEHLRGDPAGVGDLGGDQPLEPPQPGPLDVGDGEGDEDPAGAGHRWGSNLVEGAREGQAAGTPSSSESTSSDGPKFDR